MYAMMQAITLKKIENKLSQMGHTKKYLKKQRKVPWSFDVRDLQEVAALRLRDQRWRGRSSTSQYFGNRYL
jgi:hypothetical protein